MSQKTEGFRQAGSTASGFAQAEMLSHLVRNMLTRIRTAVPVEVLAVTNSGGVEPIGYVNVRPLVQQLNGDGNVIDHSIIHNVPYMRIQGGKNAVILDPEVGDIGMVAICDRDISSVKASKKVAPPGSGRRHSMSDAVYLNSIIAAAPTQYVRFAESGIELVSPTKVMIQAPENEILGNVAITGSSLTHNGVNVGSTHVHPDPQGSETGGPQ